VWGGRGQRRRGEEWKVFCGLECRIYWSRVIGCREGFCDERFRSQAWSFNPEASGQRTWPIATAGWVGPKSDRTPGQRRPRASGRGPWGLGPRSEV
jgi:hypothetical protein